MQYKLLTIALLVSSQAAFAATPPDAGSTLQQIPAAPALKKSLPEIRVEQGGVPAAPVTDNTKITVNSLRIEGAKAFASSELVAFTGFKPGSELSLTELRGMASKIADYYHSHGYFVAQAYLLAQDIKGGAVTITVIEGQYGRIRLNNQSKLSDRLANSLLGGIDAGAAITADRLESRLLTLSDLPGVNVKSTLVPGASVGTSDLIVDVTPGRRVTGSIDADNEGNRYTGKNRIGANLNLNNLAGYGDVASLRAFTSGNGLSYGRASYQIQIGKAKVGVAYADMSYYLGSDYASLQATGTAKISSLYGSYPLIRSRSNNLYVQLAFDSKSLQDKTGVPQSITDKKVNVWMAGINGDRRDSFGGGGYMGYGATLHTGNLNAIATAANSNGSYSKMDFNALRLQSLTDTASFYAAINGQFASKNLDNSEKMELGGSNGVRAYPEGEAYADQGYVLNLEVRKQLAQFRDIQPQFIGFVDTGTVTLNKNPWVAGQNSRTLSGFGVGLNLSSNDSYLIKAYYAHKLGNAVATSAPDSNSRIWVQGVKYF